MQLTERDLELLTWMNSLGFVTVYHVSENNGDYRYKNNEVNMPNNTG